MLSIVTPSSDTECQSINNVESIACLALALSDVRPVLIFLHGLWGSTPLILRSIVDVLAAGTDMIAELDPYAVLEAMDAAKFSEVLTVG